MFKSPVAILLSCFLFVASLSFSEAIEAKSVKRAPHSKIKKTPAKKHAVAKAKSKKAGTKKQIVASKKHKKTSAKKQLVASKKYKTTKTIAKKTKSSPGRSVASISPKKKLHKLKAKKHKRSLPKEYGTI